MVKVTVGKIARMHGVRGEVVVDVRTDAPDERFAPGAVLSTEAPSRSEPSRSEPSRRGSASSVSVPPTLTVARTRWHQQRLLVQFSGVDDRSAAEGLRGVLLLADATDDDGPTDADEYFDHQLVGLNVVTGDGDAVGEVREIMHGPGQDVLVVQAEDGAEVLVPFVSEIVPEVDVRGGRLVVAPPPGLLDLPRSRGEA